MKHTLLSAAGLLMLLAFTAAANSNGLDAVNKQSDDSVITAKVKSALLQEPAARARQISVKTKHGIVELSGTVESVEIKQRAEVIASTTEGVTDVRNDLKVRTTSKLPGTVDSAVVAKVREALIDDPATRQRNISVATVQQGTVQLRGTVASADEKMEASKAAVTVNGVQHVENSLQVAPLGETH